MSEPNARPAGTHCGANCNTAKKPSEWSRLGDELCNRVKKPAKRVVFVIYFFVVVVVVDGLGWLIPLARLCYSGDEISILEVPTACSAFFLALLAAGLADIVLGEDLGSESLPTQTTYKGFKMLALGLSLLGIPLAVAGIQRSHLALAYLASSIGLVLSLFVWWVLNGDRPQWHDPVPEPITAAGGPTAVDLPGTTDGLTA